MSNLHVRVCATNPIGSESSLIIAEGEVDYARILVFLSKLYYHHGMVQAMILTVSSDDITFGCERPMLDELGLKPTTELYSSPWYCFFISRGDGHDDLEAFEQLLNLVNALAVTRKTFAAQKATQHLTQLRESLVL